MARKSVMITYFASVDSVTEVLVRKPNAQEGAV